MRKILFVLITFLFLCEASLADRIVVPFTCYPREVQQKFADNGMKLDLDPNERTKDSWGFIENRGQEFYIMTYKHATIDELNLIKKIIFETER